MSAHVAVQVAVERWAADDFPGWVECRLVDSLGRDWRFVEKAPVVSSSNLTANSAYPTTGLIAARRLSSRRDEAGREVVEIDTEQPWGVQAVGGGYRFTVFADQLRAL